MTTLPRPLTPLERALLRAVVELGDGAFAVRIRKRASLIYGSSLRLPGVEDDLRKLEEAGLLVSKRFEMFYTDRGTRARRYWRPVGDLAAVLAANTEQE